jgi:hypothetical protein
VLLAVMLAAGIVLRTGLTGGNSPLSSARACPPAASVTVGTIVVPAGPVAGYCQDRLINAAHIMTAARALGIGPHTQAIGVMTALGESGLRVLDHGDAAGADSRGLVKTPGWKGLSPGEAAHTVQVNADPHHYDPYWARAEAIVASLGK